MEVTLQRSRCIELIEAESDGHGLDKMLTDDNGDDHVPKVRG